MTTAAAERAPTAFSTASLYVGDLNPDVCEPDLFAKFSPIGPILSIRVCRDAITRRSLGYAYVNFQQAVDAERALESLNFEFLSGKPMRIMWCQRDPAMRRSGSSNIFIKNLDRCIDNKSIFDTFSMFGNILSCKVALDGEGKSKGYAFVHFEVEESAAQAIEKVNGMLLADKKVYVGKFLSRQARAQLGVGQKFTNIFVKNFSDELNEAEFEKLFSNFGEIVSAVVMMDEDGNSRGFGFVAYRTPEEAARAVEEMRDYELPSGRKIFVCRAMKKRERSAELKRRFDNLKAERQQLYQGVNLYVKNLDDSFTDAKLREVFEEFGNITSAKVMTDKTGVSKGFGFVCFDNTESADKATQVSGRIIGTKPLVVCKAQRKEDRKAQLASMFMERIAQTRAYNAGVAANSIAPPSGAPMYAAPQVRNQRPAAAVVAASVPHQIRPAAPRWNAVGTTAANNIGIPPHYFVQGFGQVGRAIDVGHAVIPEDGMNPAQGYNPDFRSRFSSAGSGVYVQPRLNYQQMGFKFPTANIDKAGRPSVLGRPTPNAPSDREGSLDSLNAYSLAQATPEQQKLILGERLYPLVGRYQQGPDQGKITGMMLDIEPAELLMLLENEDELKAKVGEAARVLAESKNNMTFH